MGVPENIDALLVKHDITQEALARIAGVTPGAVSGWRKGAMPREEALQSMCDYFGLEKDDIISDSYGLAAKEHGHLKPLDVYSSGEATVPLVTLGRVHAGPLTDEEVVAQRIEVPASILASHPHARAALVEGNCMNRVVPEGLAVVYDPDLEPADNKIAIVENENYQAVMRRYRRGRNTVMLVADSYEDYDDIIITEDDGPIRLIGTVVWVQSVEDMG